MQAAHLEKESRVASPRIQIKLKRAWVTSALCWKFTGKGESKATASLQQALYLSSMVQPSLSLY